MNDPIQSGRQGRRNIPSPHRRMVEFLKQHGGEVRFDVFAREHLTGSGGFYSDNIDLSREHGPVATPMDMEPGYRKSYANKVLNTVATVAKRSGKNHIRICEIGPGGGELHREIINQFNENKDKYPEVESITYIALDPNQHHLENIRAQGGHGVKGIAQALPLVDGSIDVLVAEEVLDSLPYRMFKITQDRLPGDEAFVRLNGNQLELAFCPIKAPPEEVDILSMVAKLALKDKPNARVFRYSDDYLSFWSEIHRVVSDDGIALVSDYSTQGFMGAFSMGPDDLGHEETALRSPYQVDLTHLINFDLQTAFASHAGFKPNRENINPTDMRTFVTQIVGGREVIVADKRSRLSPLYDNTYLM